MRLILAALRAMLSWRLARAGCACVCVVLPRAATAAQVDSPSTCRVGAYLISLYDLDPTNRSFAADLWLWSTCPSQELHPLEVMDFVDAKEVHRSLATTSERSGMYWSYVRVSGVFRHAWDVRSYPFDRHVLRIVVENTDTPASVFSYTADHEGSKPSRDIRLDGWRITDFQIDEQTYIYDTIFGDPAFAGKEESDYARLVISVSIARTKLWSFFKLVTGVYVAVALSILTFLLGPYNGRRRTSVLAGTLFAVLINQRVAESVIGRTEEVTLTDEIHLIAMVYIFAIALAGIYSQSLFDRDRQKEAVRSDIRGLWLTSVSYVILNLVVVGAASIRG